MSNLSVAFCLAASLCGGAVLTTHYTSITGRTCVTTSSNQETGDTITRCPGVAGYSLLIINSDDRASISIVTDDRRTLPLDFWDVVTPTFSTLGPKVEWQVESMHGEKKPVAIIVRVHTVDQTDVEAPRSLSFLVVAAIRNGTACVIGKIPAAQAAANESARALAKDRSSQCLPQIH